MDVELYDVLRVYEYGAVADCADVIIQSGAGALSEIFFVFFDDTLGAVGEFDIFGGKFGEIRLCARAGSFFRCFDRLSFECGQHPVQHHDKALAACVHDMRFFQHGKLLRRFFQRRFRRFYHL